MYYFMKGYEHRYIELDLNKVELFGWEPSNSDKSIAAMIKGILAGDEIPRVPIHRQTENVYFLSPLWETKDGLQDAGHTRAVAHYIENRILKCVLLDGGPCNPPDTDVNIKDIEIVDDTGQYEERIKRFPNYRRVE